MLRINFFICNIVKSLYNMKHNIGTQIMLARKNAGLTQKQLGDLIGVHPVNVSSIEKSRHYPKIETLKKIAKELNVSFEVH
jgi:transcriptional regulator with XRE-family HTH domain